MKNFFYVITIIMFIFLIAISIVNINEYYFLKREYNFSVIKLDSYNSRISDYEDFVEKKENELDSVKNNIDEDKRKEYERWIQDTKKVQSYLK